MRTIVVLVGWGLNRAINETIKTINLQHSTTACDCQPEHAPGDSAFSEIRTSRARFELTARQSFTAFFRGQRLDNHSNMTTTNYQIDVFNALVADSNTIVSEFPIRAALSALLSARPVKRRDCEQMQEDR